MNNSDYIKYDEEDGLPIFYISKEDYIKKVNTIKGINTITDTTKSLFEQLYELIMEELSYKPIVEHKCNNCGAPLKMDADNYLFKCRYCGTAYLIGTNQING